MLILDDEAVAQLSSEDIPTLAIKSIVSSTKPVINSSYLNSVSEPISSPVKGTFWFTMVFSASLLASVLTTGILLFMR